MIIRILLKGEEQVPFSNNKKTNNYYIDILESLKKPTKTLSLFSQAVSIIDAVAKSDSYRNDAPAGLTRLKNFSNLLTQLAVQSRKL